jgi:hypothetical protein
MKDTELFQMALGLIPPWSIDTRLMPRENGSTFISTGSSLL